MRKARLLLALAVAGCGEASGVDPSGDVVGPYPGAALRFVVDQLELPRRRSDFADDLNGDHALDNQLYGVVGLLVAGANLNKATGDMLASGALTPTVEVTSDDPTLQESSAPVGVRFIGADGEAADTMGARLHAGYLISNRTRTTTHPVTAKVRLPLWADADATVVSLVGAEIELSPDGKGGLYGQLHGGVHEGVVDAAYPGLVQMARARPEDHGCIYQLYDANRDRQITRDEFAAEQVTRSVLVPDVQLFKGGKWAPQSRNDAPDSLSIGISFHLVPCAQGRCGVGAVVDHCDDRVRDADESDVDCGGSCHPCPGGAACATAADCQAPSCDAGKCAEPTLPPPHCP